MSTQPKDQAKNEHNIEIHDHKTSVLSAFDALHEPEKEQEKKLLVAKLGDLEPVIYVDHKGKEHHLLAAPKVIGNMMALEADNIFIPKKRKEIGEDSQPDQTPCLIRNIVLNSHCSALLSKSNYIELDPQTALLLNSSWTLNPMAAKSCAHLLEEAIFVEGGKSLLVLGGEIYSRLPSLDAHYEKTSKSKGNIPQSSLPHTDTRYQNVELCLIDDDNAKKLVLGTKTMNVLITSSIRLESNQSVAVGTSSSNGFIPCRSTRIFIEKYKLQEIQMTTEANTQLDGIRSSHQHLLYPFDEHAQLRQLRSKFDRLSTYLCYRFSSKFTNDVRTRPYTIWTIADRSRNQDIDSSAVASSKLFKHIATQVWENGAEASLSLNTITSLKRQFKQSGNVERIFDCIEDLYEDNISTTTIIGNKELSNLLEDLAALLSFEIVKGNEQISKNIQHVFNEASN
ncbi:hypothetical protein INT47_010953 [Mucor saturninus]|uniref:Uncharacterized protein n=1 Tax=Mucor saturninus TaxID=64648 RepID=A0A8H7VB63_9FUNG|nr:hypothetical protein INT47_010953 [Mucor saturninus]